MFSLSSDFFSRWSCREVLDHIEVVGADPGFEEVTGGCRIVLYMCRTLHRRFMWWSKIRVIEDAFKHLSSNRDGRIVRGVAGSYAAFLRAI